MDPVRDMLGQEIKPGATLLYPKGNELKLALVESINLTYTAASPDKPTTSVRLSGRRSDSRYISSPVSITNASKYVVLQEVPQSFAQGTSAPGQHASFTLPQGISSMLVGSAIS